MNLVQQHLYWSVADNWPFVHLSLVAFCTWLVFLSMLTVTIVPVVSFSLIIAYRVNPNTSLSFFSPYKHHDFFVKKTDCHTCHRPSIFLEMLCPVRDHGRMLEYSCNTLLAHILGHVITCTRSNIMLKQWQTTSCDRQITWLIYCVSLFMINIWAGFESCTNPCVSIHISVTLWKQDHHFCAMQKAQSWYLQMHMLESWSVDEGLNKNVGLIVLNISHIKEFTDIYCTNFPTTEILFLHVLDTFCRIWVFINSFSLQNSLDFVNLFYTVKRGKKNLSKLITFKRNKRPILWHSASAYLIKCIRPIYMSYM